MSPNNRSLMCYLPLLSGTAHNLVLMPKCEDADLLKIVAPDA